VPLAQIAGERVPHWQVFQPSLSHDGRWLALPLNDFTTTNLYFFRPLMGHGGKSPTSALVEPSSYAEWLGRQTTGIYSLQSAMAMPISF